MLSTTFRQETGNGHLSASPPFTDLNNLASAEVGAKILFATDDFFAVAENLLNPAPPEWKEGVFTAFGKWMDGWETRRKRIPSHDWCLIKLGVAGIIKGFDIDTSFFTGNYPPRISIQAACLDNDESFPERVSEIGTCPTEDQMKQAESIESQKWVEIVPRSNLKPGYTESCHNYFTVSENSRFTHIRLNLFPDGGIARLRVYGVALRDWKGFPQHEMVDLAAMVNGGTAVACSNKHYGHPRNLIAPGRAPNMGSGWETARRLDRPAVLRLREDGCLDVTGNEWTVLKLGHPGIIKKIEVDTNHFKGNFPDSCLIEGCIMTTEEEQKFTSDQEKFEPAWRTLLPSTKLFAHRQMFFTSTIQDCGIIFHVRLTIFPDGGISRLRLMGYLRSLQDNALPSKLSGLN
ncbi:allantoicase isoform X1 [Nematostella vectensis]|uniref:allantoicase isoform X1 n=1 Tax=Nematostella vectensis TaxID=45351 RepID=UPI002077446D|nr:allantoicase isoform X1 [Nematostella vectensis]